jgi:hypothetical protein
MSKWVVDIHGDIEGDYEIIKKYEEPKTDVLDKIRAEIIENSIEDYEYHGCGTDELIIETSQVLKIIDKYKAESEDKE